MNHLLKIHPKIKEALQNNQPVVALESTIISHGMPYPKNVETALAVEKIIENEGAIPATIAIINGVCCVGLTVEEIETFGNASNVEKVSTRDIPYILNQKLFGATTVAATMKIASMAGIKVFVTGGIGGVHRGATTTMDISADIIAMYDTNVAIVSAGIKSILDVGLTLEVLETHGIPVITYGQKKLPGFYSNDSGFDSPLFLHKTEDIAKVIQTKWQLKLNGSVLIANPLPKEFEVENTEIEKHILQALAEADQQKITGKNITPFLLKHIANHTKGESLEANIALIKNNALIGAKIAKELAALNTN
ncbi:MAG: pseudouridine-5'-phosphate glycosidase [Chitinophagaceae bacterium]